MVAAVTTGRLDGFAWLVEIFGTWEQILQGQAELLADPCWAMQGFRQASC